MIVRPTISVHALLVDEHSFAQKQLLLCRLAYGDHRYRKWSFPGGFVDIGESLETALRREVREEIGVELQHWEQVGMTPLLEQETPHIGFLFRCEQWLGIPKEMSRELLEIAWVDCGTFKQIAKEDGLAYPQMIPQVACLDWFICGTTGEGKSDGVSS
ncbi:MAG: NUDIX hydrolase [Magnetococcus sp. DMHC-6]